MTTRPAPRRRAGPRGAGSGTSATPPADRAQFGRGTPVGSLARASNSASAFATRLRARRAGLLPQAPARLAPSALGSRPAPTVRLAPRRAARGALGLALARGPAARTLVLRARGVREALRARPELGLDARAARVASLLFWRACPAPAHPSLACGLPRGPAGGSQHRRRNRPLASSALRRPRGRSSRRRACGERDRAGVASAGRRAGTVRGSRLRRARRAAPASRAGAAAGGAPAAPSRSALDPRPPCLSQGRRGSRTPSRSAAATAHDHAGRRKPGPDAASRCAPAGAVSIRLRTRAENESKYPAGALRGHLRKRPVRPPALAAAAAQASHSATCWRTASGLGLGQLPVEEGGEPGDHVRAHAPSARMRAPR